MAAAKNAKNVQQTGKRSVLRAGLASGSFVTAVIVVIVVSLYVPIDWGVLMVLVAALLGLAVGVPGLMRLKGEDRERADEKATCEPILTAFGKSKSADRLLADYEAWQQGDHSSYTRVHFGAQIIDALRDAKEYERALAVLRDLSSVDMKARDRYDYDNYRAECEPQLLEAIEAQRRHDAERARNKNLRGKK